MRHSSDIAVKSLAESYGSFVSIPGCTACALMIRPMVWPSAGAGLVLDDYRLADGLGHLGGDDAREHIGCPAGWERRNDADRLGWILRERGGAKDERGGCERELWCGHANLSGSADTAKACQLQLLVRQLR